MDGIERRLFGEYENPSDELLALMRRMDDTRSVRSNGDYVATARAVESAHRRREAAKMALEMFRAI